MYRRLGEFVSRFWLLAILFWIGLVVFIKWQAPAWDDVTHDGDLAYMPDRMSSVQGEVLLEKAFPDGRSKSEMVIIVSRDEERLSPDDAAVVDRIAARLHNLWGVSSYLKAERLWKEAAELRLAEKEKEADQAVVESNRLKTLAVDAWTEATDFDREHSFAWFNLARYYDSLNEHQKAVDHRQLAFDFNRGLKDQDPTKLLPATADGMPVIDVWTYRTPIFGEKLHNKYAQLLVLRLSQEFMATENIAILEEVQRIIDESNSAATANLSIGLTGSAAIGADMLQSSAESIRNTELYTVILVVVILLFVYRSPLLIAVPLVTITVSLIVATGSVAALTQLHLIEGLEWWNFKVFTTTKIFVVVILFGAGTDYCLFLISRFREELNHDGSNNREAVAAAVASVSDALVGSAFTTIVGFAMMFFADFGKFRNSGPAIGLCLVITLLSCLTLAPALLRAMGRGIFWPFGNSGSEEGKDENATMLGRIWSTLARWILAYPGRIMIACTLAMIPFAYMGAGVQVTYDFLSELDPQRPSKIGTDAMRRHFPVGETGPLVVLAKTDGKDLDSDEGKIALLDLTNSLYIDGVQAVRSLSSPMGERIKSVTVRTLAVQAHEMTRALYLSKRPELDGDVARFELVLENEPFSIESIHTLNNVEALLNEKGTAAGSYWAGTSFLFSGTTAAIRDLRTVTRADNIRIQILVVLGVLGVLLILLRRPVVCLYLIISVLFSYYATLGATELFFKYAYGDTFQGLDWKVPLFLFVILVAIGQDYNIYLATRVFEEQKNHGMFAGLRRAIVRTGGIITSCGVIMAGTFISMTTGSLRGIVELGFALSLGVLLDTFIVRPILVPAFLALLFRYTAADSNVGSWFKERRQMQAVSAK